MSQEHQHLTTEQLSACIDKQLSVEEQSLVDKHLKQCEQCQLWLQELRATVWLVHALPQPQLPRSFALPADVLVTALPVQAEQAGRIVTTRRARSARVWIAMRAVSALAAVVGIVLLLSGLLSFSHNVASSAVSATSGVSVSTEASTQSNQPLHTSQTRRTMTPQVMSTSGSQESGFALQATATVVPQSQPEHAQKVPSTSASPVFLFEPSQSSGRIALGVILLILGCAGFIYLRFQHSA